MMLKKTLLGLSLLLPALLVQAHEYTAGELHIEHPWSREMPAVAPTAAAYFVVHNKGSDADRLLSREFSHADLAARVRDELAELKRLAFGAATHDNVTS